VTLYLVQNPFMTLKWETEEPFRRRSKKTGDYVKSITCSSEQWKCLHYVVFASHISCKETSVLPTNIRLCSTQPVKQEHETCQTRLTQGKNKRKEILESLVVSSPVKPQVFEISRQHIVEQELPTITHQDQRRSWGPKSSSVLTKDKGLEARSLQMV
jgi:hypothetical protein